MKILKNGNFLKFQQVELEGLKGSLNLAINGIECPLTLAS